MEWDHLGLQDAGADAHQPTQLPGRSSFSIASSWRKSLRSTATARTLCFLATGWRKSAGHHGAVAGALQHVFQFLHRHHFHGHVEAGFQFLGEHRGADVLAGGATSTRAPQRSRQSISRVSSSRVCCKVQPDEQFIDALADFPIEIGDAAVADVGGVLISRGFC